MQIPVCKEVWPAFVYVNQPLYCSKLSNLYITNCPFDKLFIQPMPQNQHIKPDQTILIPKKISQMHSAWQLATN
jgi:hypothetical protein